MGKKRNLTIGERPTTCPAHDIYGDERIITIVEERHPFESIEEKHEEVEEFMYSRIYSEYDCTGQWFTMRHDLYKLPGYWAIKLYERVDL